MFQPIAFNIASIHTVMKHEGIYADLNHPQRFVTESAFLPLAQDGNVPTIIQSPAHVNPQTNVATWYDDNGMTETARYKAWISYPRNHFAAGRLDDEFLRDPGNGEMDDKSTICAETYTLRFARPTCADAVGVLRDKDLTEYQLRTWVEYALRFRYGGQNGYYIIGATPIFPQIAMESTYFVKLDVSVMDPFRTIKELRSVSPTRDDELIDLFAVFPDPRHAIDAYLAQRCDGHDDEEPHGGCDDPFNLNTLSDFPVAAAELMICAKASTIYRCDGSSRGGVNNDETGSEACHSFIITGHGAVITKGIVSCTPAAEARSVCTDDTFVMLSREHGPRVDGRTVRVQPPPQSRFGNWAADELLHVPQAPSSQMPYNHRDTHSQQPFLFRRTSDPNLPKIDV